ncbi:MAG: cell envelope biogenesis protein OmpA [Flavobacterium sp. MedPE-SWcel]|uniref:OmpA family protein n=1 Tax=uncultured Flavobacterium sp. TaxID=165435 RepID=UPI0009160AEC|nr:OmpA family protein [uncultured Flavobacterium sp.]OIQ22095.1 MAG: cell envelope biogenesis protein OmpA [Flavobacterium sp. MedPE-SWcel]
MKKSILYILLFLFPLLLSAQEQFSVYFDTNKHELTKVEMASLNAWMDANKTSKILAINGYTDEDGTTGLNDTLAQRRVRYVFDIVKGKVKTREDFKTHSFGELHDMSAVKAENRKVTLYYLLEKDLAKENEILGIKEEPKPVVKKKAPINYPDRIILNDPRGGRHVIKLDVEFMQKVSSAKAGEKLEIKNLNFHLNTFAIVAESRPRLYELLHIMRANPKLKLKLLGHICCVNGDPRKLSYQRAKAVAMFLRKNGIERERVTFEGLGTTDPIYALPENNDEERAANRRVEVLVLENP